MHFIGLGQKSRSGKQMQQFDRKGDFIRINKTCETDADRGRSKYDLTERRPITGIPHLKRCIRDRFR